MTNTFELAASRPRLRDDLIVTPHSSGNDPFFVIEDPLRSRFYRVGQAEYIFISLFDGTTTIQEAFSHLSTVLPDHELSESDAAGISCWLMENSLLRAGDRGPADSGRAASSTPGWNPLVFRLPLFQPDRLFALLATWLGWFYSPPAALGGLLLLTAGAYRVCSEWDRFVASSRGIFAPDNWLWLAGCWVLLKIFHEASHGIACRRHGAAVRETGLLFVLLAPMAYVDVTSSWRLPSRWHRIQVAAAGMYVELLIAAAAAIAWSNSSSGWLSHTAFNVVIMASFTTLVFNANPLMKFDGYYILSDVLGIANLYVNGQAYISYLARKHLLGVPAELPAAPRGKAVITRVYGIASLVWRIVICVSLALAATTLFHGAGIVLAVLAGVIWLGLPLLRFATYLRFGKPGERPQLLRFLGLAGGAVAACGLVLGLVPWPGVRRAPAVVEFAPHTVVRAGSSGFVSEVHVAGGQQVQPGQVLLVLENRELVRELADLELRIRQSEIRARRHEQKGEFAARQAEWKDRESLSIERAEKQAQIEQLVVRAPRGGQAIRRNLDALLGTFLEKGDQILAVGNEQKKELRVSIGQDDLESFAGRLGKPLRVDLPRLPLWKSNLERISPRASNEVTHPGLTAINGGPLAVTAASRKAGEGESHELLLPRFDGFVPLTEAQSESVRVGQCGVVRCRPCDEPIGKHLLNLVSRWIRERCTTREG